MISLYTRRSITAMETQLRIAHSFGLVWLLVASFSPLGVWKVLADSVPPTTAARVATVTSKYDEGIFTSSQATSPAPEKAPTLSHPEEAAETSPAKEGTKDAARINEEGSSTDQEEAKSPVTSSSQEAAATSSAQEAATSSAQEEVAAKLSSQEEAATLSAQEEVATLPSPEVPATSSAPEDTTSSSAQEEAATLSTQEKATSSGHEEAATSSTQEKAATSSAQEEVTSSAQDEAATSSAQDEATKLSAQEEATTSSGHEEAATSSTQEKAATSSAQEEVASSAQNEEATTSVQDEKATPSAQEVAATSSSQEEAATSSAQQEAATSSSQEEAATSYAQEEATSFAKEAATSSAKEEAVTSSAQEEAATSSSKEEAATSPAQEEATSSVQEEAATPSTQEEAISSTQEESTTLSAQKEGATSSAEEATPSAQEEAATSSAQEEAATLPAPEEPAASSAREAAATSSTQEEAATSSAQEETATSSTQEEAATPSAQEEAATSSTQEEAATPSAQEETAASSAQEEAATSSGKYDIQQTAGIDEEEESKADPEEATSTGTEEIKIVSETDIATKSSALEETTSHVPEVPATSPAKEDIKDAAGIDEQEESTVNPEEDVAATSFAPNVTPTASSPEVAVTSPMPEEADTLPAPKESGTSLLTVEATSSTSLQEETSSAFEGNTTTSTPGEATTSIAPQGTSPVLEEPTTTSAPEETIPTIAVADRPSSPLNIITRYMSETGLEVSWESPRQPNGKILSYTINVIEPNKGVIRRLQVPGNEYSFQVGPLDPSIEYGFAMAAANQYGQGVWSEPVYSETIEVEEPFLELSHNSDFVVSGMGKSTRVICFIRGQQFLGWYKSTGEQITGKDSRDRMYVENEEDSYSLVIQRLKLTDGGIYTCQGSKTKASHTLYVEFSIVDPPTKQILQAGKEGVIYVGVMIGYPAPEYLWRKNGLKFNPNIDRFSLQPDGSIKINKVLPVDDGRYSVRISQLNRRRETTKRIEVVVIDPPQFTEIPEPSARNLTKGYPASFECSATGIPPPKITWTGPDGKPIDESDSRMSVESDGSLKLAVVELEDVGTWTCEAKSSVGQISVQAEVQAIYTPPEIQPVNDITVDEGDSAVLNCSASGFPVPNVVWIKNDREYPGQMRSPGLSSITFSNLGLQDISLFTCEASNAATNEEGEVVVISEDAHLYVMVEPKPYDNELTKGPVYRTLGNPVPVTFVCVFTGYPPPLVSISKDGRIVATGVDSAAYNITAQSLQDYGIYYCAAENDVKPSSLNYSLEVRRPEPPQFTVGPILPSRNLTVGFPVSINWTISGIPKPDVKLKSPTGMYVSLDDPRFAFTEGNITIKALQEIDAGTWTLEATNILGTETASIDLGIVYVTPKIAPILDVVVNEGEGARLECNATGFPVPDVVWIKAGEEFTGQEKFPGGSVINLSDLGLEDNSQLTCEARNGAQDGEGNELYDSASITLIVKVQPRPVDVLLSGPPIVSYIGDLTPTVLNCSFSGFPPPEVKIVKDGKVLVNSTESVSYSVTVDEMEDFGVYVCRAENEVKAADENYIFEIISAEPPQFTVGPILPSRNLTVGFQVSINWTISGIPKPDVKLKIPTGMYVSLDDPRFAFTEGNLIIKALQEIDAGTLTLEATNILGTETASIDLGIVYVAPKIAPILDVVVNEGEGARLECNATGFPVPDVVWIKAGEEFTGQEKFPGGSVVNLSDLGLEDNSKLTCEARNGAQDGEGNELYDSASITLVVKVQPRPVDVLLSVPPIVSYIGDPTPTVLNCSFSGFPPPQVKIVKDGKVLVNSTESVSYSITVDEMEDFGVYVCTAENEVKVADENYIFEIIAAEPPQFTVGPILPSRNLTVGFQVSINWTISGIPKPDVKLKKSTGMYVSLDDPRFAFTEGNLIIKALQEIDAGTWTLEATNILGTETASIDLGIVYVTPKIASILDVVVNEGEGARLECNATGFPVPDVVWIKAGEEFTGQEKFLGGSVINLSDLGLEDNSQLTCEARNGAQDGEGNELYDSASITLIVKVEPRRVIALLRGPPIVSYIGDPKPTVISCAFSGFPPPEVKLFKDDQLLVNGTESLSYSVTVDEMEDFGVYVCTAENEVKPSDSNFTLEIIAAGPPSKPRDVTAQASCDDIILSWEPPEKDGGFPVIEYIIKFGHKTVTVSPESKRRVIENLNHSTIYSIELTARTEAALGKPAMVKPKTSQFCQILSCANIDHVGDLYTFNASQGRWPNNGFCQALSAQNAPDTKTYMISVDFYVPKVTKTSTANFLGVLFNAEDQNNFEFIFFRIGEITGPCYQTGEIQSGRFNWYGSQTGSCAQGAPRKGRWTHTMVEIRDSDVSIFLDGVFVTAFKGHFPAKGFGGLLVANHEGNVVRFKDFMLSEIPSMPFQTKSCASAKENAEFFSLISQPDLRPRDFCRALYDQSDAVESSSYQVSVDLYSEADWSGDNTAFLGIMFNARDINNADFIYFRPYWKDHCYQTGYLMGGRQLREGARTGPCSCTVQGEKWFNVRLEIRGNAVIVFMDNIPATVFKSHFPASSKGSGVMITGGCRTSIRFRNFTLSSLPPLPFETKNCQSARLGGGGDYYKLMTYSGLKDFTQPGICRAFYPKVIAGNSYVIRVKFYTKGSLLGGKYGVIFNVKNADNFEFVYFRPYQRDKCAQAGYLRGTKVREFEPKSLSCAYGFMRSGSWYDVRVKVSDSEVKVYIDDVEVSVFRSQFSVYGRGGIMVISGLKRKISFKDYQISE